MVFPDKMDKLDTRDVIGSLQKIEKYLEYMCERIEFSSSNDRKKTESEIRELKQQLGLK